MALPVIPAVDVEYALDDIAELLEHPTICGDPRCDCSDGDLHQCSGGCGQLVTPNFFGIAWCGQSNCRAYAKAEYRADMNGARI